MGKDSSAKKVARAAGLGGNRAYSARPAYGFYVSIAILVILGIIGVYNAHEYQIGKQKTQGDFAPKVGLSPPWYEGYAVDECGKIQPPIKSNKNPVGITTKGSGVISISPTTKLASGHNATLYTFSNAVGMTFNAGELKLPGGKLYSDGQSCEGKAGHIYVEVWASPAEPQADGTIETSKNTEDLCNPDCESGVLLNNDQLVTIAFLPAGKDNKPPTDIPLPPTSVTKALSAAEAATAATTTTAAVPTSVPTTAAGQTTTTVPGQTTTTVKGQTTTTVKGQTTTSVATKPTTTVKAKTTTTVKAAT